MSFTQAVQSVFQNYANFSGRAMRSEYWWWFLFTILANVALSVVELAVGLTGVLTGLWVIGTFLPGLAVAVRRLHDRGHSGWFILIVFIPLIGALIFFYQMVMPGDDVSNEHGDPPTGP